MIPYYVPENSILCDLWINDFFVALWPYVQSRITLYRYYSKIQASR